jgi:UDP-2-acetamido-3-amino-2,3-dideoxy-glucuronate N-acetyltransferase
VGNNRIDSNMSVAVIGTGYWGKNLVRNYYELGALKLICDKNEETVAALQEKCPGTEACLSMDDAIVRSDIDGIVIATPAETHYELALNALKAGKHVYVEKPLVLSVDEAHELITLADQRKKVLMVGHLLHYHPVFIRLKQLVHEGELGRINYIYSNRLNLGKIRREENILWSFAPHDISMILSLADEEPESVCSIGANYLHREIADVTTTHLKFSSGLRAHIFVSWLHPIKEQKLVVVGDRKMAVFNDTEPWPDKLLLYPHRINWEKNIPIPDKAEAEHVDFQPTEPLKEECRTFLQCCRTGEKPATDGREGLGVLKVLNASQRSLDNHGREVRLVDIDPKAASRQSAGDHAKNYFAHNSAVIDERVVIGSGTNIWHFTHLLSDSVIGDKCNIGQNVMIGPDVRIGNRCKIQNNVSVYKGVTLEDGVFCGPSMVFTNIYNPRAEIRKMDQVRTTLVKRGATLGANCTIVCGITIGRYAFIGAGAVAVRDVPSHALIVGNPGRQIGWVCECGETLSEQLCCSSCSKTYIRQGAGLIVKQDGSSHRAA